MTANTNMRFLVLGNCDYGDPSALDRACRAALAAAYSGGVDGVVLAGDALARPDAPDAPERLKRLADSLIEILEEAALVVTTDSSAAELAGGSHPLPGGFSADQVAAVAGEPNFGQAPFPYAIVHADGEKLTAQPRQLVNTIPGLVDTHVHTQFAYCGTDVTDEGAIQRARQFGLAGVCLTEHAGQLYVAKEDFWSADFIHSPELWRAGSRERMDNYLALADPLRADDVLVGFESEIDREGNLILRDEDRQRADILLGAVHWLNVDIGSMTDNEYATAFCRQTEQLLAADVDVLVHPVRLFARKGLAIPTEVQQTVACLLAETNTPGEINFHKNDTPVEFYRICLDAGVKLALGSDSHRMAQVGNLDSHVRLLQQLTGEEDIAKYTWSPFTDREDGNA